MTIKFCCVDEETNKDLVKFNVFERREADSSEKDWRICSLEWIDCLYEKESERVNEY